MRILFQDKAAQRHSDGAKKEAPLPRPGALVVSSLRRLATLSLLLAAPLSAAAPAEPAPPGNPAIDRFNPAITFYASFDGHSTADLSAGSGKASGNAQKLQWEKGLLGQALRGRTVNLIYPAQGNIDLSVPGALALWVCPERWNDADKPPQVGFATLHNHGRTLVLARQGGKSNHQALMAIYGPNANDAKTRALVKNGSSQHWKPGQWHLLVVNWGEGYVELSVDGGVFRRGSTRHPAAKPTDDPGQLAIGAGGFPTTPYRLDELLLLDRPLSHEEAQWLYQTLTQPGPKAPPPAAPQP